MKLTFTLAALALLAACTTPTVTMKHSKTGQIVTCGGSSGASWAGGAIGYNIQKDHDASCEANYRKQGFRVVSRTKE